ncbi:MAG TPA: hypothetical protein VNM47_19375, partial [Terriglobia bacterium]|nr:hypothetical protein [Terriglobia bacterium]
APSLGTSWYGLSVSPNPNRFCSFSRLTQCFPCAYKFSQNQHWDSTDFEKRTREVVENKGLATKNEPKRTQKQSRDVGENTFLWKKQTQNEPENEPGHVGENTGQQKSCSGYRVEADVCEKG